MPVFSLEYGAYVTISSKRNGRRDRSTFSFPRNGAIETRFQGENWSLLELGFGLLAEDLQLVRLPDVVLEHEAQAHDQ